MKRTLMLVLALIITACGSAAQPTPVASPTDPGQVLEAPTAAPPSPTMSAEEPSPAPLPTDTPEPQPTAAPITEPTVVARFPMSMGEDGLGFGLMLLALPGGQVWEATSGGGLRVYDSADLSLLKSLDLRGTENSIIRMAGDEQYVWVMFSYPGEGGAPDFFRVSRADYSHKRVALPDACTYEACQWSTLLLDGGVVWLGGYDELLGLDRDTLAPLTQFLYSEQAQSFMPAGVKDLDVGPDGRLWSLFCTDTCYIIILDRELLLNGGEQQPEWVYFASSEIEFVTAAGGTMWAGEGDNSSDEVWTTTLYRLEDVQQDLAPENGIALPDGLDFFAMIGPVAVDDGRYLWLLDDDGRALYWFDPQAQQIAGRLEVYPGDEPTDEDPNMIMSISFDGQSLWTNGSEILCIALPLAE